MGAHERNAESCYLYTGTKPELRASGSADRYQAKGGKEMSQPNEGQDRLDYSESADITEVHASVLREHAEPRAGSMPIPMWLGLLCAGALTWAGAYVGMFHGGFSGKVYDEYASSPGAMFPLKTQQGAGAAAAEVPLLALGEKVYGTTCVSCHQSNGMGNPANNVPPLAGSEWVDGAEFGDKRLV